jgi:hypothetical protein
MVEMVVVLVPLLTLSLSVLELCRFSIASLMLQRSAGIAVRACAVIKEQPLHCDSNAESDGQSSGDQDAQITEAARRAILPLTDATLVVDAAACHVAKDAKGKLEYPGPRPVASDVAFAGPDQVDVYARYHCAVPLARSIVCSGFDRNAPLDPPFRRMAASARHGHQGARYDCRVGSDFTVVGF